MISTETSISQPIVSVVIEGYNELNDLGTAAETIEALKQQTFPLDQTEIVLVGTSVQSEAWKTQFSNTPFYSVKTFAADGINYYALKNICTEIASGEVLAFTDSDVCPRPNWVASAVEAIKNGADVVVGPSLFRNKYFGPDSVIMQAAASIAWGFVVGEDKQNKQLTAASMLSHNSAFRTNLFREFQFRTEFGRTCSAVLLYRTLVEAGCKVVLQPKQQTVHSFSWDWWLLRFHRRIGYEVFQLRRLDHAYPDQWITKVKILEPLLTLVWHILLDIPRWFRFSKALGISPIRRLLSLPIVIALATAARSCEMVGMYSTLIAPQAMKRWAELS